MSRVRCASFALLLRYGIIARTWANRNFPRHVLERQSREPFEETKDIGGAGIQNDKPRTQAQADPGRGSYLQEKQRRCSKQTGTNRENRRFYNILLGTPLAAAVAVRCDQEGRADSEKQKWTKCNHPRIGLND